MPVFVPDLQRLLASGATLADAGKQLGISRSAAGRWIARYPGKINRRQKPRIEEERREQILELRRSGRSIRAIASAVGVSRRSVRRIQTPRRYRCPSCGGLNVHPECIACRVTAA